MSLWAVATRPSALPSLRFAASLGLVLGARWAGRGGRVGRRARGDCLGGVRWWQGFLKHCLEVRDQGSWRAGARRRRDAAARVAVAVRRAVPGSGMA